MSEAIKAEVARLKREMAERPLPDITKIPFLTPEDLCGCPRNVVCGKAGCPYRRRIT